MTEAEEFAQFLERLRRGDAEATAELWRRYEPAIRMEIRCHLNPGLRRRFDSEDVRQDVFKTFFVHFRLGRYDFAGPGDLAGLLRDIARKKLAMRARKERAQKRHPGREEAVGDDWDHAGGEPDPGQLCEQQELVDRAQQLLAEDERRLLELRRQNRTWEQIAAELGGTAAARQKQLERAVQRISRQLALTEDEAEDEHG